MDASTTATLLYNSVVYDFNGLFSIRRLFCLGLLIGVSVMDGIMHMFETMNPDKLPVDFIDNKDMDEDTGRVYQKQLEVIMTIRINS